MTSLPKAWFVGALVAYSLIGGKVYAWGERGHHLVALDAARLCEQEWGPQTQIAQIFLTKEHMLGHLANVPDIVWRGIDKATTDSNAPTHHFDVEFVMKDPTLAALPRTFAAMAAMVRDRCKEESGEPLCADVAAQGDAAAAKAGTAPFRIQQLQQRMAESFAKAGKAKDHKELVDAVNDALLYGGIFAHFVGDLAQPLHATNDYDGYGTGHGGLHGYFESEIVNAQDLNLEPEVLRFAQFNKAPFNKILNSVHPKERDNPAQLPRE